MSTLCGGGVAVWRWVMGDGEGLLGSELRKKVPPARLLACTSER
jgi:hypothetical protein